MSSDERAVLGDELQQRGDPQGELIALQLALEALPATAPKVRRAAIERRIATCLDQHHDAFYGALAPHVQRASLPDLLDPALVVKQWLGGFADSLWVQTRLAGPDLPDTLRMARGLAIAQFVRRLELAPGNHPSAVAELVRTPWPRVRELVLFGDWGALRQLAHVELVDLRGADALLAQLELLRLDYEITYTTFESDTLRSLALVARRNDPSQTPTLVFDARLPALEELTYWNFAPETGVFERYPRLRRVTFSCDRIADWLEYLLTSPHIERFTHVTAGTGLGSAGLEMLARNAHRFAHLELLDLTNDLFAADALAAVRPRLPPCVKLRGR